MTDSNRDTNLISHFKRHTRVVTVMLAGVALFAWRQESIVMTGLAKGMNELPAKIQDQARVLAEKTTVEIMPIQELNKGNQPPPTCTYPYVAVEDVVVEGDPYLEADGTRRKIPRSIHLAWVSANDGAPRQGRCLHYLQAETIQKYQENFPNYSIYFHDDDAVDALLQPQLWPQFPELANILHCSKMRGAMLVDIWRQLIMYNYGGFYADLDLRPGKDFNETTILPEADFFSFGDAWTRPSQWGFGMAPGHPVAYYTMREIIKRVLALENIAYPKLVFLTGPEALKFGYGAAFGWDTIGKTGIIHGAYNITSQKLGDRVQKKYNKVYLTTNVDLLVSESSNMTYKEKIKNDTGVLHWNQELGAMKKRAIPKMSCKDYLHQLEMERLHPQLVRTM